MPLMTSPIDGSPMKEIERYGIKLDMCQTSGGIWFDKGEIEKFIYFVREETIKEHNNSGVSSYSNEPGYGHKDHKYNQAKRRKRNGPFAEIMEMFEL